MILVTSSAPSATSDPLRYRIFPFSAKVVLHFMDFSSPSFPELRSGFEASSEKNSVSAKPNPPKESWRLLFPVRESPLRLRPAVFFY